MCAAWLDGTELRQTPTPSSPLALDDDIQQNQGSALGGLFLDCNEFGQSLIDSKFAILLIVDFLHVF